MQYCTHITSYHEKYSICEIYRQSDKGDASLKSGAAGAVEISSLPFS